MRIRWIIGLIALAGLSTSAHADWLTYEVTITNITKGQTFTPQLVATHRKDVAIFELGQPASEELALLAEGGSTAELTALLEGTHGVHEVQTIGGLLGPGESASTTVTAPRRHRYLSLAAMLIPTNDTFVALNGVQMPRSGSATGHAKAYDAGSEPNDQNCLNIPGPRCMGAGPSDPSDDDEGFVYVGNGFHELPANEDPETDGEVLGPLVYDWRNPVAKIVVRRIHY